MIKRTLYNDLISHLPQKEISLIVGPRQAGKTTLMYLLKEYLDKQGETTVFLNLDLESDQQFFSSQASLISKIRLEAGDNMAYVFVDEIQRKENAGLFLKGLYDANLPWKFIVSGSGSLELKEKIHESLVGRKRIFHLNTLSFEEFVNFRTEYRYQQNLAAFFAVERIRTKELLLEYLNFGGYPRVVLETLLKEKARIIDEIFRSYLEKDVSYLLKIERTQAFGSLIKLLASQIGMLTNFSELSSTLGIALKTLKTYLWYAERTFIVERLTPFFRNVRKEITKAPIFYFTDLGLRNYSLGLFGNLTSPSEMGFVFQNFIFNILKERLQFAPAEIHFWRTKDKAEVDFVVEIGRDLVPIEVKYKELKGPVIGRALRSFITKYEPRRAWVVNLDLCAKTKLGKTTVEFFPYHELISNPDRLHLYP